MNYLELYLDEIRHHLPPKNREDILKEIRSTLMDMIEDRNPTPGQTPDESIIKDTLREFGSPKKVARQYGGHNYLIGPSIFPTYLKILKIVLIIAASFNLLGLIIAGINQTVFEAGVLVAILEIVGGFFSSLFIAFGIVTLSFGMIEKSAPENWHVELDKDWTPDDLPKTEHIERVSVTGLAVEITMGIVFIALINFFLDRIGIYYLTDTGWVSAPILNENFLRYIPWMTAYAVLDILLNLYLIRKGFWDKTATLLKVFISAFTIAVLVAIITGPAVITINPNAWQALNISLDFTAQGLSRTLNTVLDVLLGLAIFGLIVESIKRFYETFIKGSGVDVEINMD